MKFLNMKNGNNKGFTLLEILVVISIIGILIALGTSAYGVAQKKSRDARRSGDLKAMQNAFEQYYTNNSSAYNTCNLMAVEFPSGLLPTDPKGTGTFIYTCQGNAAAYCACAQLESGTGNAATGALTTACSYGTGDFFCVSNLQ